MLEIVIMQPVCAVRDLVERICYDTNLKHARNIHFAWQRMDALLQSVKVSGQQSIAMNCSSKGRDREE